MCGIFGIAARPGLFTSRQVERYVGELIRLSESRGKESSGVAIAADAAIHVLKRPVPGTSLVHTREYRRFLDAAAQWDADHSVMVMGHSRLVTNGTQYAHQNNQPVLREAVVGIHNGIIVNDEALWRGHPQLVKKSDVDSDALFALLESRLVAGRPPSVALAEAFAEVEGTASIAAILADRKATLLATNNGSLYFLTEPNGGYVVFGSEEHIVREFSRRTGVGEKTGTVTPLNAAEAAIIEYAPGAFSVRAFALRDAEASSSAASRVEAKRSILDFEPTKDSTAPVAVPAPCSPADLARFEIDTRPIDRLRRCTKCILPETMPFITFDGAGVCNYCHSHKLHKYLGADALKQVLEPIRSKNGRPDCLVTLSGGRDSSYSLHYMVKEMGMRPITYTYDWGMVTDLARRNLARLCGKLGVEHILVSADIARKREYIRRNVSAWLKKPSLGLIPLFMAGDKQYFYYANMLRTRLNLQTVVLAANPYEKTHFKTGFCGVEPAVKNKPSVMSQGKLLAYYAGQYLRNPRLLNRSLVDTGVAFASYYVIPHDYLRFHSYIDWDEDKLTKTLLAEYDWETASDTKSTWRIGDGTASFYNYIYFLVAGFTENDTFRSNQIREGRVERSWALERVKTENQPRFESIQWYCDTIGLDMREALQAISKMRRLYRPEAG